jgi:hypothetical protein
VTGVSREWVQAPQDSGVGSKYDWFCRDCAAKPESADQSLRMFCVHCIRELRRKYDPKFKE